MARRGIPVIPQSLHTCMILVIIEIEGAIKGFMTYGGNIQGEAGKLTEKVLNVSIEFFLYLTHSDFLCSF